jgi:hypothetical protein
MKVVISERQYNFIQEQSIPFYGTYDNNELVFRATTDLRNKYPIIDTLVPLGVWFVPYIGPYLSATLSSLNAVDKIKKGKTAEGIIELITSPLALMKTIKVLQTMGGSDKTVKMLQAINKSGITLLVAEGQEAFLKWGYKKFGADFLIFANLLIDKVKMKGLLSQFKDEKNKTVPPKKV